ncbi:peroxiredoxin [Evansella vedderi]|uniref:Peroxiredoxin n=1 Tax=Evansella vedderi TaxID=38282 RepID=A0ABT9ZVH2_9BACI|nr:TlpA disulfide reductase family protein [Evansella vedderi]MDQ0255242.1 peroxiredoxin [Evansella vedderi]
MKAPFFSLPGLLTDEKASLHDFEGKVVLLTFWVSWCPDSQRDLENKQQLFTAMDTEQLEMVMINVTGRESSSEKGIQYYQEKGYTFPCLKDKGTATYDLYQCMSVPTTFLINKDQDIVQRYNDKATFQDILKGISTVI